MVPIELVWIIIVLLFGLIGVVRGYLKELGVTTVLTIVIFGLSAVEARIMPAIYPKVSRWLSVEQVVYWQTVAWTFGIVVTSFVSYHGQTLAFEGKVPANALGVSLSLGAGLVNGYLIAGSLWFYIDRLGYPYLCITSSNLTPAAQQMLHWLPPVFLGPYLLYVGIFLVLMRVIR